MYADTSTQRERDLNGSGRYGEKYVKSDSDNSLNGLHSSREREKCP